MYEPIKEIKKEDGLIKVTIDTTKDKYICSAEVGREVAKIYGIKYFTELKVFSYNIFEKKSIVTYEIPKGVVYV